MKRCLFIILALSLWNCEKEKESPLFTKLSSEETGIDFENTVSHTPEFNMYTYRNFYNGAGLGMGDINNDGLPDIFFCGNLVDNKLYLNKGNFQFEDITEKAGVASQNVWSTGVSFADVNADGWLDIYVCKSGKPGGDKRHNELFINNGDLTFTEKAKEYGIADEGLSNHAAFFDYDKDGDLDMYLLNNSFRPVGNYDLVPGLREIRDSLGGNKLYRNDVSVDDEGNIIKGYSDVSEIAGIYGSAIGFGLGVTIGDINGDHWQDIFVSNDFFERDYLYINQQDGTFKEDLINQMSETSFGSMGADMADLNNDGFPEIFVTEMLPASDARYKTKMTFESWDTYQKRLQAGYHHQFTRNVLQLNNGNGTFSEIGRMAGVHATDWSWSALLADFDNDGFQDIYVSNGIYKDLLDQDYIKFYSNDPKIIQALKNKEPDAILKLIDLIPSEPISNVAFRNKGTLQFENITEAWGLDIPSHSNGSIYGDLDRDGDLDMVVNNSNMPPFIFRNEAVQSRSNNFLQIILQGKDNNRFALGSKVILSVGEKKFIRELSPMRGFQSCVDHSLHFGLGEIETIDELQIIWPNGNTLSQLQVPTNQILTFNQAEYSGIEKNEVQKNFDPSPLLNAIEPLFSFRHTENNFVDFDRDRLIYHMLSREGPRIAKGDANNDGLADVYICGASGQPGALFLQQGDETFLPSNQEVFASDALFENVDALFVDIDGDEDQDLYVANGGNEFERPSAALVDRIYLNDGYGNFSKARGFLPSNFIENSSCVIASDIDADGDQDLFVGTRLRSGLYGLPVSSTLLLNDGKGRFSNATKIMAPGLLQLGMITDAKWMDIDGDTDEDLWVVGEWMPITVFENKDGKFEKMAIKGFQFSHGLWNCIAADDLDGDGKMDLVLGNHGLNSRFKASKEKPLSLYVNDFDKNSRAEQILTRFEGDRAYPFALRHDLTEQLPMLKKKYLLYKDYKEQVIEDIFTEKQIRTSAVSQVYMTESSIAWNEGDGNFRLERLPQSVQIAPVYGIEISDIDKDGLKDILLGGNFMHGKPEVGSYNASYGWTLMGKGNQSFELLSQVASGFLVKGEIRDIKSLPVGNKEVYMVAKNNGAVAMFARGTK